MPFIAKADFATQISDDILNQIVANNDSIIDSAALKAQSEIESYLSNRYDCTAIFAATGTNRNEAIVMRMVDMALYHIYARVSPKNISEVRYERYQTAIEWLKMSGTGKLSPNLPLLEDQEGEVKQGIIYGSTPNPIGEY